MPYIASINSFQIKTMEALDKFLLYSHIFVGSLSLILFWIPVFVKKGGNVHIKVGWAYVYTMWYVLITAVLLSIINLIQGNPIIAAFLGFLALITAYPLWYGISILKYKKDIPQNMLAIRKLLNVLILLGGLGLIIWAIALKMQGQAILLLIFGILGVSSATPIVISRSGPKKSWLSEHIEGMIGTGIAAYTAFFAFGASRMFANIFAGPLIAIPWVLPTIIGTIIIIWTKKKNGLSFGK